MDGMSEEAFKECRPEERHWILYSMMQNVHVKIEKDEGRIKKLENRKLIDRGISAASGAFGGGFTIFCLWLKGLIGKG